MLIIFSFEQIYKKKVSFFEKYTHIVNTTIHKNYIKKKYDDNYDLDKKFIEKFKEIKFIYIFF